MPGRSLYFWCRTEWAARLLPSGAEKRLSGVCDGFSRYKKQRFMRCFFNFPDRLFLFHDLEGILVESANGAYPVVRDVFECRAGCDAAFGIALGRIIYVVAGGAVVFAGEYAVGHLVPVDQLPVRFDEIRAAVAVVDIVGVFPIRRSS